MEYLKGSIDTLTGRFGSPLIVFDERGFKENYQRLETAMRSRYEKYRVAYSYKTNYTPYICRTAKSLGAFAEVVSGMEYALAKRIGYDDAHIIFNGPEKGPDGLKAFLNGCLVNADSLDELKVLCESASAHPGKDYRIGLRINLDIGQGFVSRFGMDEKDVEQAFQCVRMVKNLRIAGLHCHISRCRTLDAWRKRTEIMLDLADRFFDDEPEFLDLGSGMFGSMAPELASQFGAVPAYEEYAEVTAEKVSKHYAGTNGPLLFTEPGTTLINRFMECIARVVSIKRVRDRCFAILDASVHTLGETCLLKKLPVTVISGGAPQKDYTEIDLTGYTCLEQDVLYHSFSGKLAEGDYIVFGNTGGYSNVLKPPFIRPSGAIVAERTDGDYQLIKAAETGEDIFRTYLF